MKPRQELINDYIAAAERSLATLKEVQDKDVTQRAVAASTLFTIAGVLDEFCAPKKRKKKLQ